MQTVYYTWHCSSYIIPSTIIQTTQMLIGQLHYCFEAVFKQVQKDHPTFKVGETLTEIIADWSDQHASTWALKDCWQISS